MYGGPWNEHRRTVIKPTVSDFKKVLRAPTNLLSGGEIIKGNITSKWHHSARDMFWIPILVLRTDFKQANHNEVAWPISAGSAEQLESYLEWPWSKEGLLILGMGQAFIQYTTYISTLRWNSCEVVNETILYAKAGTWLTWLGPSWSEHGARNTKAVASVAI